MDERDAIARLKDRDIGALEPLVHHYQWEALRVATLITRDRNLAEEVVQEAFVRVFERIDQFDASRPFAPWFFRIVANDAVKAAKRAPFVSSVATPSVDLIDRGTGPDEVVEALERSDSIQQALEQLPPEQRAAIVTRYYLGMTDSETAEHVGNPRGTIKWRLHTARKRLRVLLHSYDPEPLNSSSPPTNEEKDR